MSYKNLSITPPQFTSQSATKQSQFYRGFSTVDETSSAVALYDQELIKQDLFNQLSTIKGERVMNPEFGTIIWNVIFDPLTSQLKEEIQNDINRILASDPRIKPIQVLMIEKEYGILLEATITYTNSDQVDNMKLSFDREIGLTVVR
jgi:phage baseplate assembly protein W